MRMSKRFNEGLPPKLYKCANCGTHHPKGEMADIRIVQYGPDKQELSRSPKEHQVFRMRVCLDCVDKAEAVLADWAEFPYKDEKNVNSKAF